MMNFSRSLLLRFSNLRTPKNLMRLSAKSLRISKNLLDTLKASVKAPGSKALLGDCHCKNTVLACNCPPVYLVRKDLDYSGHQPDSNERRDRGLKL